MLGEITQRKLDFLRSSKQEALVRTLHRSFQQTIQPLRLETPLPPALFRILEIDLIYALVKNLTWHLAPIFKDVIIDFLKNDYRFSTELAENIANPVLSHLLEHMTRSAKNAVPHLHPANMGTLTTTTASQRDKEFLRYIFIATAAAADEEAVLADLGLGRGILNKIRHSVATASRPNTAGATIARSAGKASRSVAEVVFVPEVEAIFSELLVELSQASKTCPWVTDVYRLRYELLDLVEPWQSILTDEGVDWLFQLLLKIGGSGTLSQPQIDALLTNSLSKYALSAHAGKQLMTALHAAELVMGLAGGKMPDPAILHWRLLPKAEALTSAAFAHQFHRDHALPLLTELLNLPALYQATVLKTWPVPLPCSLLEEVALAQPKPFAPATLDWVLQQISRQFAPAHAETLLLQAIERHRTPWHRAVVLHNLRFVPSFAVAQKLRQVAQSDPSPTVREAAEVTLILTQESQKDAELMSFDGQRS